MEQKAMDWAALVQAIAARLCLSQVELAERCDVARQTVSAWQRGKRVPGFYARRRLQELAAMAGLAVGGAPVPVEGGVVVAEGAGRWEVLSAPLRELLTLAQTLSPEALREVTDFARYKALQR